MTAQKKQKRLFGTNGVRGVAGKDITPELAFSIGRALGYLRKGRIAVGRDTRTSGEMLSKALKAGLLATGCDVYDCGILPTPALQYLVRDGYDGGAVITASHNPPEYNGVKIIEPDGTEMGDEETLQLEDLIFSPARPLTTWDQAGQETQLPDGTGRYIEGILNHFTGSPGKGMTVVVDPGSGPACITTPKILEGLGCRVLTVNGIMDGTFPGRLPEPSLEGLKNLADLVVSSRASFGVAHDGDADRAVFVDENGQFIEENAEFAIIVQDICRRKKGIVVTPVSSGQVVEEAARREGSSIWYTPVGSIYVARTMRTLMERGEPVILGGEGNGGLIFPDHQFCRDGGMTAAMMVSLLATSKKKVSELARELPQRHIIKDRIVAKKGAEILAGLIRHYPDSRIDMTDGVKIYKGDAWALVRASGTEPIIRIIIDAKTPSEGKALYKDIKARLQSMVG
ncbi:MAG: phosphoglucosamine mutase [Methanoregula sp.]|nr:phosphoglucosamine mutase [Methanoregula sp.]